MYILMGMKHCGKSTLGRLTAKKMGLPFFDLDDEIEKLYSKDKIIPVREIYRTAGKKGFKELEFKAALSLMSRYSGDTVLSLGGGTIENNRTMEILKKTDSLFVFIDVEEPVLFKRIFESGIPPFLDRDNPEMSFHILYEKRVPLYRKHADIIVHLGSGTPEEGASEIIKGIRKSLK